MKQRNPTPKPENLLVAKAAEWERRRRRLFTLTLSLDGLLATLAAGILIAFVAQLFPFPFHAAVLSGVLVGLGFLICGGIGVFRPSDASASLLAADQRLGLKERLSTAYELLRSQKNHPFTAVLASDAASHARNIRAKEVHPLIAPNRWRLLPLLTAVLLVFLLVDFGLPSPRRSGRDAALAEQGKSLEDLGKKLASRATRDFFPETMRLAQEMERLGNELQRGELNREEAADQLNELADQAEQRAQEMQQQMDQDRQPGDGSPGDSQDYTTVPLAPGGGGADDGGERIEGLMDPEGPPGGGPPGEQLPQDFGPAGDETGGSGSGGSQSGRQKQQEIENLEELEEALRDSAQQLTMGDAQEESESSEGDSPDSGSDVSVQLQEREGEDPGDSPGGPSPGSQGDPGQPGTQAVADEGGETGGFTDLSREDTSEIESTPDEGDTLRGVLRALPLASPPQKPLEDVIADYGRQLEENIERETVPLNFKQYIRDYFVIIGILGKGTE